MASRACGAPVDGAGKKPGSLDRTMQRKLLSSSTGTKILIAVTGLALFAFLIFHLAGNLMVFGGRDTFNAYTHKLEGLGSLVYFIEFALLGIFVLHIYKAVTNFTGNRNARPQSYYAKPVPLTSRRPGAGSKKSPASSTMIVTGIITILFVVIHLKGLKFGPYYEAEQGYRDMYRTEVEHFGNPLNVAFYTVAMGVIGFHIWHGFWSAFQSLGLGNSEHTPKLVNAAKAMSILIAGGFAVIPIYLYFKIVSGG